MTSKGCERCKFLVRQDCGWSNWTVEYTSLDCLLGAHPHMPCDDSAINAVLEPILGFGDTCASRQDGDPVYLDVDGEVTAEQYKDDPVVHALLVKWGTK